MQYGKSARDLPSQPFNSRVTGDGKGSASVGGPWQAAAYPEGVVRFSKCPVGKLSARAVWWVATGTAARPEAGVVTDVLAVLHDSTPIAHTLHRLTGEARVDGRPPAGGTRAGAVRSWSVPADHVSQIRELMAPRQRRRVGWATTRSTVTKRRRSGPGRLEVKAGRHR